jgi:hypothetical protein
MSANMARQGGQLQLEQSDMCLALNMAKMAIEGFLRTTMEKTKYPIQQSHTKVRDEKKQGVAFPCYKML